MEGYPISRDSIASHLDSALVEASFGYGYGSRLDVAVDPSRGAKLDFLRSGNVSFQLSFDDHVGGRGLPLEFPSLMNVEEPPELSDTVETASYLHVRFAFQLPLNVNTGS